jgi:hypothetical protein
VEGGLQPKFEYYGTSKTMRKDKRTSNYNWNCHTQDYINWDHVGETNVEKN